MTAPAAEIRFETFGDAPEMWGAVQANFLIIRPGENRIEVATLLNHPAIAYLAEKLGVERTEEFERAAARAVGARWLQRRVEREERVGPFVTISRATLEADPWLEEGLSETLGA